MLYRKYKEDYRKTTRHLPVRTKASLYTLKIVREKLKQINEKKKQNEDSQLIRDLENRFKVLERCFVDNAKTHEEVIYDSGNIFYDAHSMAWYYFCTSAYIKDRQTISYDHLKLIPTFKYKKINVFFQYVPYTIHDIDRKDLYSKIDMLKDKEEYTLILVTGKPTYKKYFALVKYQGVVREMLINLGSLRELVPEVLSSKGRFHIDPHENRPAMAKKYPDFAEAIELVNRLTFINSVPLYE